MTKPALTGEWEFKLHKIEDGELDSKTFMKEIVSMTKDVVESIKSYEENEDDLLPSDLVSPYDGEPLFESLRAYRTKDNSFAIYKIIGNRKMDKEELRELLEKKRIGPIDGFRSKRGKHYSAYLILDDETKRVKFDFGNGGEQGGEIDFSALTPFAKCPRTGGDVYETANAYVVKVPDEKSDANPIRISRKILDREIPREQVIKLLETGKTDLLDKFWSKRTKRPFDAYLVLNDNGQTKFEFPPRAPKKAAKKVAKKKTASKT